MKDVMIDIETLGRKPGCPILSIGAVYFDRNSDDLGQSMLVKVSLEDCVNCGFQMDPSTIKWWMEQSDSARAEAFSGTTTLKQALTGLRNFLVHDALVWGNGATFDISILELAYNLLGMEVPWKFLNIRDCRTVEDLSPLDRSSFPRQGTHHSALDDAVYQAQYISAMIRSLK